MVLFDLRPVMQRISSCVTKLQCPSQLPDAMISSVETPLLGKLTEGPRLLVLPGLSVLMLFRNPQMAKQLLIAGLEKYYQLVKRFRMRFIGDRQLSYADIVRALSMRKISKKWSKDAETSLEDTLNRYSNPVPRITHYAAMNNTY